PACSLFAALATFSLAPPLAPPIFHSFPTRRSSDLDASALVERHDAVVLTIQLQRLLARGDFPTLIDDAIGQPLRDDQRGKVAARDRKSTRLNSSHRTISYAVFCLKKKKTHTTHSAC